MQTGKTNADVIEDMALTIKATQLQAPIRVTCYEKAQGWDNGKVQVRFLIRFKSVALIRKTLITVQGFDFG